MPIPNKPILFWKSVFTSELQPKVENFLSMSTVVDMVTLGQCSNKTKLNISKMENDTIIALRLVLVIVPWTYLFLMTLD